MPGYHIHYRRSNTISADSTVTGSGILPFFKDKNGVPHFLLGKEQYVQNWKGSLRWSGFEGGRKEGETVEENAAREFVEETLGIFTLNKEELIKSLCESEYALQVRFSVHNAVPRVHVTFVKEFAWVDNIEQIFSEKHAIFTEIQALCI